VLFAPELVEIVREADLFVLNLECCISARGEPWPGRVFHFRAPPWAAEALALKGLKTLVPPVNRDFSAPRTEF
jgi:poly-gamma-glutamate synthesis protein (capsule biosynthesis protein)